MMVSLKRLHKYYNSLHHYPIFIFHEDYTQEDIQQFRMEYGHPLHFVRVNFEVLPSCVTRVNKTEYENWMRKFGNPLGYRQMCRFWSIVAQNTPVLSSYEFYLRLDDDTMMTSTVDYDLFEYMSRFNKTYVYAKKFADEVHQQNLWKAFADWKGEEVANNGIELGETAIPYNNFHASRVDFWKSQAIGDLFEYLEDRECGFIQYAWGDANFHAVAVANFLTDTQVQKLPFPVQHNWNTANPEDDSWAYYPDDLIK